MDTLANMRLAGVRLGGVLLLGALLTAGCPARPALQGDASLDVGAAADRSVRDAGPDGPPIDGGLYPLDLIGPYFDGPAGPSPPAAHRVTYLYAQGMTTEHPYWQVSVRADGTERVPDRSIVNMKLIPLESPALPRRIRDLRHVVQRSTVAGVSPAPLEINGRWYWRYTQSPKPPLRQGAAYQGVLVYGAHPMGPANTPYRTLNCPSCPKLGSTLAISPAGDYVALSRDDGSVVLLGPGSTREIALGGGPLETASLALSGKALYAVSGGPAVSGGRTLWRVPFSPADAKAQTLTPAVLSNGQQPSWISGAEGLITHRGLNSDLLVFTGARPAATEGPLELPHEDLYAAFDGQAPTRRTSQLGALGAGPELTVISPSGQRVAFVRSESDGWQELVVAYTFAGAPPAPPALKTRQVFSGGALQVDALRFIDEHRLLAVLGPAPAPGGVAVRHAFLVDLTTGSWKNLLHDAAAPFDWTKLPAERIDRVWIGPQAQRVVLWSGDGKTDAMKVAVVDLASGARTTALGQAPAASAEPLRCGLTGQVVLFVLRDALGGNTLSLVDLSTPTPKIHVLAAMGGKMGGLTCGRQSPFAGFATYDGGTGSVWVVDTRDPPSAMYIAKETREIGQILIGRKGAWVYYVVGTELKGLPSQGGVASTLLYKSYGNVIILDGE